jgi:hypothetical protein
LSGGTAPSLLRPGHDLCTRRWAMVDTVASLMFAGILTVLLLLAMTVWDRLHRGTPTE